MQNSGVVKAGPGRACAQPKFILLMSRDHAQSTSVVSAMVKHSRCLAITNDLATPLVQSTQHQSVAVILSTLFRDPVLFRLVSDMDTFLSELKSEVDAGPWYLLVSTILGHDTISL